MYRLDDLLGKMVELEASDLYLAAESKPMLAVDGQLRPVGDDVLGPSDTLALACQAMTDDQVRDLQENLEVNLGYKANGARFRLNVYHQKGTVAAVVRLIRQTAMS